MRSARPRVAGLGVLVVAATCAASGGCANVIGLDGLVYDREPSGSGGAASATSTGDATSSGAAPTTGDGSSGSTAPTSSSSGGDGGAGATSSGSSGGEGEGGSGASGQGGGGGGPTCGDTIGGGGSAAYRDMMLVANPAYYRFDEADGALEIIDSKYDYDGNLLLHDGYVDYELEGVFDDDAAMSFTDGAQAEVPHGDVFWDHDWTGVDPAFTVSFFAKLDGSPSPPVVVAQCYDDVDKRGWVAEIDTHARIRVYGRDGGGGVANDVIELPFPADGCWHHVTLFRPSGSNDLRGYLDGVQAVADTQATITEMVAHTSNLYIGAAPGAGVGTPTLALDELIIIPFGLNDDQIERQSDCLMGGSCASDVF